MTILPLLECKIPPHPPKALEVICGMYCIQFIQHFGGIPFSLV